MVSLPYKMGKKASTNQGTIQRTVHGVSNAGRLRFWQLVDRAFVTGHSAGRHRSARSDETSSQKH